MRGYFFCAIAAMFASSAVSAESWVTFAANSDISMAVDTDSIMRKGGVVSFWVQTIRPNPAKPYVLAGERVDKQLDKWIINCAERTHASGAGAAYRKDGSVIVSTKGAPFDFTDIIPGTAPDQIRQAACPEGR